MEYIWNFRIRGIQILNCLSKEEYNYKEKCDDLKQIEKKVYLSYSLFYSIKFYPCSSVTILILIIGVMSLNYCVIKNKKLSSKRIAYRITHQQYAKHQQRNTLCFQNFLYILCVLLNKIYSKLLHIFFKQTVRCKFILIFLKAGFIAQLKYQRITGSLCSSYKYLNI